MCKTLKQNGEACKAPVTTDGYCYFHSPYLEEARRLSKTAGRNPKYEFIVYNKQINEIKNAGDIKRLMSDLMIAVLKGELPTGQPLNSITYLAKVFIDAHKLDEVEKRIASLEDKMQNPQLNSGSGYEKYLEEVQEK